MGEKNDGSSQAGIGGYEERGLASEQNGELHSERITKTDDYGNDKQSNIGTTEAIESAGAAIELQTETYGVGAANVKDSKQAGELAERIQETIDQVDERLYQVRLNLEAYSTEGINHELAWEKKAEENFPSANTPKP